MIQLEAYVQPDALRQAVDRDLIEKITLIKKDPVHSDKFKDAAQWGDDEVDRLEMTVPSRRLKRLKRDPLKRFLDNPTEENRNQIVVFAGLKFDEAAVTVEVESGVMRTFYLEERRGGHAMTVKLDLHHFDRYGATSEELARELQEALRFAR